MSNSTLTTASGNSNHPIRVVPLKMAPGEIVLAEKALVASPAHLSYRSGPMLASVQVSTIYWGSAWATDPLRQLTSDLNDFFVFILKSPLMDQLSEYDVGAYAVGQGALADSATIAS